MKALILAAGKGTRLGSLTSALPKALVPINGRPLIEYILETLDHPSIEEIGVVGGYQFELLESLLKTRKKVRTFYNPHFADGSIRTIITALDFINTDLALFNADHIYPKKLLNSYLRQCRNGNITIACDFDRTLVADDMKIKKGRSGFLTKIRKDLTEYDGGYIGSTFVPKEMIGSYKKAVLSSYEIYGKEVNAEAVIGHMAANDHQIAIADLSGIGWWEVDTQEDLKRAEGELRISVKN